MYYIFYILLTNCDMGYGLNQLYDVTINMGISFIGSSKLCWFVLDRWSCWLINHTGCIINFPSPKYSKCQLT